MPYDDDCTLAAWVVLRPLTPESSTPLNGDHEGLLETPADIVAADEGDDDVDDDDDDDADDAAAADADEICAAVDPKRSFGPDAPVPGAVEMSGILSCCLN
jgi:hypothetical protein|eukprot:COSAG01_NODE_197_length_22333_cov_45.774759_22_plen_101_part_00